MNKKLILIATAGFFLTGCAADNATQKQEQKKLFDEVMAIHDELMNYESILMTNKETLDSLAKTPALKDSAELLGKQLTLADEAMSDWMHDFNPDYSSKPHDEAIQYLTKQKVQIMKVDTLTKNAASVSGKFISSH